MGDNPGREFNYGDADFNRVKAAIYRKAGIYLADSKKQLVYSRLARRLRFLRLHSFSEYMDYLESTPQELQEFINALTTNLTAFFRESHHFDLLSSFIKKRGHNKPCRIWCAASSTGEEPYSIAMTLVQAYASYKPPVEIIASDIDSQVLATASAGIYNLERVDSLSMEQKKNFFLRGKGINSGKVRIINDLRKLIDFRQINLLDREWPVSGKFDVIFCRNVMIYFDKPTQLKLLERMTQLLEPDGIYIAGHSESFTHAAHLVTLVGKSTYQLTATDIAGASYEL